MYAVQEVLTINTTSLHYRIVLHLVVITCWYGIQCNRYFTKFLVDTSRIWLSVENAVSDFTDFRTSSDSSNPYSRQEGKDTESIPCFRARGFICKRCQLGVDLAHGTSRFTINQVFRENSGSTPL